MPYDVPRKNLIRRSGRRRRAAVLPTAAALLSAVVGTAYAADSGAVSRGAYLAAAAGCDQCHSAENGPSYGGGRALASPFGIVFTPNITPDKTAGIGNWSEADFTRAMRFGIAPDDSHFLPVFPYAYYAALTEGDLSDLRAYLYSLSPSNHAQTQSASAPSLFKRAQAMIGIALNRPTPVFQSDPAHDAIWNRGAYLVATVGRCSDCHTPSDRIGIPDQTQFLAGTVAGSDGKKVPNITADPETGIGKWSEDDIVTLLKEGQTPDIDFVGGAMAAIVKNTARLSGDDRHAIAVYLKTVPAKKLKSKS